MEEQMETRWCGSVDGSECISLYLCLWNQYTHTILLSIKCRYVHHMVAARKLSTKPKLLVKYLLHWYDFFLEKCKALSREQPQRDMISVCIWLSEIWDVLLAIFWTVLRIIHIFSADLTHNINCFSPRYVLSCLSYCMYFTRLRFMIPFKWI